MECSSGRGAICQCSTSPHSSLYLLAVRSDRSYSRSLKSASRSNSTAQITKDLNREQCIRRVHSRSSFYQADNLVLTSDKATVSHRPPVTGVRLSAGNGGPVGIHNGGADPHCLVWGVSACSPDPLPSPRTSQHTPP